MEGVLVTEVPVDVAPRLRVVSLRLYRLLRQQGDLTSDLTPSLLTCLGTIHRYGPVTLGRLAELERVQPPSMTRIVGQLEERGLVEREVDAADRRVVRVRLTPSAVSLLEELRTRRTVYLASRLSELTPSELDALQAALPALERLAEVSP
jgi:DNA-binding MarR family transcriptional regulator